MGPFPRGAVCEGSPPRRWMHTRAEPLRGLEDRSFSFFPSRPRPGLLEPPLPLDFLGGGVRPRWPFGDPPLPGLRVPPGDLEGLFLEPPGDLEGRLVPPGLRELPLDLGFLLPLLSRLVLLPLPRLPPRPLLAPRDCERPFEGVRTAGAVDLPLMWGKSQSLPFWHFFLSQKVHGGLCSRAGQLLPSEHLPVLA